MPQPCGTNPSRPSLVATSEATWPLLEDVLAPIGGEDAAGRFPQGLGGSDATRRRGVRFDELDGGGDDGLGHVTHGRAAGLTARRGARSMASIRGPHTPTAVTRRPPEEPPE